MTKIYVPEMSVYSCYVVRDGNTIRAYENTPERDKTINYRDYYINSNYLYQDGSQSFGSYSTLPTCLPSSVLTEEVWYRNDFDSILIIFLIMCIFCFLIPLKILLRLFRRFN